MNMLDPAYAARIGVDVGRTCTSSQPDTGEQALEIAEERFKLRSGAMDTVVVDSVAALVCQRAEIEGEMGDSHVGLRKRLMSQALRKLTGGEVLEHVSDLHEPVASEDRGDVWQPGDDDWGHGAEVLRQRAARHPAHPGHQAGQRLDWQPHA